MSRKLYSYQSNACWWLYTKSRAALYGGLGSGKTAVMLHVLSRLVYSLEVQTIMLIAPIAVCKAVWRQEAALWPKTRGLKFSLVLGNPKQRLAALAAPADIYLMNYENITWWLNETNFITDCLVFDESSLIQSWSSMRFKGRGRKIHPKTREVLKAKKGLKHVVDKFKYVYELTGTPKSGEYLGLWSQIYCLDQGAQLGRTITEFKSRYYYQYGSEPWMIKIKSKDHEKDIRKRLRTLCYRIPDSEVRAALPEIVNRYYYVDLPKKARWQYEEIEENFFLEIEDEEILVNNIAIRSSKLQQICNGAVYSETRKVLKIHDEKIDYLDSLLSGLGSSNALVIYTFRSDLDRLLAFRNAPVLKSSMVESKFNKLKDEWNNGQHPVIYGHPKSIGHGLNIQGGGHHVIFFGLHWSLDLYQQTIGRLARTGQKAEQVFVHHIVVSDTVETELMLPRLRERDESQQTFLRYFEDWQRKKKPGGAPG